MNENGITNLTTCEHCGRPNIGIDRCPHAMSKKYACPYDKSRKDREERMRHIGRWA